MKERLLKVNNISGDLGHISLGIRQPFNFELYSGEIGICFQASSSSSLGRLLFGQGQITNGSIEYHQNIQYSLENNNWKKNIGFGFREKGLISNLTLFNNLCLPVNYYDQNQSLVEKALKEASVPTEIWDKRPHEVSSSHRKMTLLARSVVLNPKFIFLDDPGANLSPTAQKELFFWLQIQKEKGMGILIATDEIYRASTWGDWYVCPKEHIRKNNFSDILSPEQLVIKEILLKQMQIKDQFDEL